MKSKIKKINKKAIILIVVAVVMSMVCLTNCSSCDRMGKSIDSNMNGGLSRVVNVYSYTGEKIATYEGKIDIQVNESKVLFDMDGKRYIYYNAVVEVIEK